MNRTSLCAALFVIVVAAPARAQTASESERAEQLFNQGSALAASGKYAEACPAFAESQRLDPALGTEFNLGLCYEKIGRLASAWRAFHSVQALAHATGKKGREDASREKLEALKPTLQFLTITTKDADATLKVDGAPIKREELDFVPVDAGVHQVEAVAQGKKSWSSTVSMPEGSRKVDVVVPPLEVIVGKTRVVTVTRDSSSTKRTLGFVVGGIGLAGLAAAGITGVLLLGDKSTADKKCTPTCVDQDGRDAVSRGKSLIPINAVAWGVGALGVGVGTFLILTSGKKATEEPPPQAKLVFVPMVGPDGARLGVSGAF